MNITTSEINKWWDSLTHEQKEYYLSKMNSYHWSKPKKVYQISKYQLRELFYEVFNIDNKTLLK